MYAGGQYQRPGRLHYLWHIRQPDRSLRNLRQHDLDDHPVAAADEIVYQLSTDWIG